EQDGRQQYLDQRESTLRPHGLPPYLIGTWRNECTSKCSRAPPSPQATTSSSSSTRGAAGSRKVVDAGAITGSGSIHSATCSDQRKRPSSRVPSWNPISSGSPTPAWSSSDCAWIAARPARSAFRTSPVARVIAPSSSVSANASSAKAITTSISVNPRARLFISGLRARERHFTGQPGDVHVPCRLVERQPDPAAGGRTIREEPDRALPLHGFDFARTRELDCKPGRDLAITPVGRDPGMCVRVDRELLRLAGA